MKDKTLYWILGIIAAYFVIRFVMNQIAGKKQENKQTAKNTTAPVAYTDKKGFYHYRGHVEGEGAGVCRECGSKTYYRRVLSPLGPGHEDVLRAVCSNSECTTHLLDY